MVPIITMIVIATVSLLAVRVGTTALMMTGLSWDAASFQSYSAFFGVGFTTREAELVVNHPVRRKIIRDLILAGNIGLTSGLATLIATLVQNSAGVQPMFILAGFILGLSGMIYLTRVAWIQRAIDRTIQRALERSGFVRIMDYELLLRIQHGYVVMEIEILPTMALVDQSLRESRPWDHGVVILAATSDGKKDHGMPSADTILKSGDVVTVYGQENSIRHLFGENVAADPHRRVDPR